MPRFPVDEVIGGHAVIRGRDALHVRKSLRKGVGDELAIRDREKGYMARITAVDAHEVSLEILFGQEMSERGSSRVHLAMSLIDLKDMDDLIRDVTELGVAEIHPVVAQRSNVREIGEKRIQRWHQIVLEAVKQCERRSLPTIHGVLTLDTFLEKTALSWTRKLVASLDSDISIQECRDPEVGVLIGPEGGFAPDEMEEIRMAGFVPVHMGRTILRSRTAAAAAVGILAM